MITGDRKSYLKAVASYDKDVEKQSKKQTKFLVSKQKKVLKSGLFIGGKAKRNLSFGTTEYEQPELL